MRDFKMVLGFGCINLKFFFFFGLKLNNESGNYCLLGLEIEKLI